MIQWIFQIRILLVKTIKRLLSSTEFRGKGSLLLALCPIRGKIDISLFGYVFQCDLAEHIQRRIFLFDYDKEAQRFVRENLQAGDTFLDIGANVGFYTLLGASIVGKTGRVIAIEPNPKTFDKMKKTIERNGLENVLALNLGLGRSESEVELFFNSAIGNDSATMVAHGATESMKVKVVKLDSVAAEHSIDKIAYLKIDVDGFEPEVFKGATNLLAEARIKAMQCEFSDVWLRRMNTSQEIVHSSLLSMGFRDVGGVPSFIAGSTVDRFFLNDKFTR